MGRRSPSPQPGVRAQIKVQPRLAHTREQWRPPRKESGVFLRPKSVAIGRLGEDVQKTAKSDDPFTCLPSIGFFHPFLDFR